MPLSGGAVPAVRQGRSAAQLAKPARRRCAVARLGMQQYDEGSKGDEGRQQAQAKEKQTEVQAELQLRDKFRRSWNTRFSGTGRGWQRPVAEDVLAQAGCPPVLKDLLPQFGTDEEILESRAKVALLQLSLDAAVADERYSDAAQLRDEMRKVGRVDPLAVYADLQQQNADIKEEGGGSTMAAAQLRAAAVQVSKYLPQYQLAGKWRGHYGRSGWENVEIRYEGDTLIATKMTGESNVPKGAVTFKADVSSKGILGLVGGEPKHPSEKIRGVLEANLDGMVSFGGEGQVAAAKFSNAMFVPGQLLMFREGFFGFLWLPLGSLIMFEYIGDRPVSWDANLCAFRGPFVCPLRCFPVP